MNSHLHSTFSAVAVWAEAIGITVLAYGFALTVYRFGRQSPLLNPVLIAILATIGLLSLRNTSYETYFQGAQVIHFLLGTATVALAVPLYHQLQALKSALIPITVSILVGSGSAAVSSLGLSLWLGASTDTVLSLLPKSTTTPVAMGIAESLGGLPALSAVTVIVTGIIGAIAGLPLLRLAGFHDLREQGIALGMAAHGVGTARAFQIDITLGAWSGLAMSLGAIATSAIAPGLWWLVQLGGLG